MLKVFSMYDEKAETFSPPVFVPTRGLAERMMLESVNDPESPIFKFPEDYKLYEFGTFNPDDGKFVLYDIPVLVLTGVQASKKVTSDAA